MLWGLIGNKFQLSAVSLPEVCPCFSQMVLEMFEVVNHFFNAISVIQQQLLYWLHVRPCMRGNG